MSDDFVKGAKPEIVAGPLNVAAEMRKDDIEFEARKRLDPKLTGQLYDDIVDTIIAPNHQAAELHGPDAAERDRIAAEERAFLAAFERGLAENLRQIQMAVTRCIPDGHGTGWRIQCRDREGRPFMVTVSYDDAIEAGMKHSSNMGQHLMALVMARLIEAREKYFARMS